MVLRRSEGIAKAMTNLTTPERVLAAIALNYLGHIHALEHQAHGNDETTAFSNQTESESAVNFIVWSHFLGIRTIFYFAGKYSNGY